TSCTAITLRMYADRKQWPVEGIEVAVSLERIDGKTVFSRNIQLKGNLDQEQKDRLLQIAKLCPVSKTLSGSIEVNSSIN
ncbi:MAG: OsmC family protein, partial [Sediminibacterium sp.]|nr:OsmC family protein [Sediminibacterium sp.]